MNEMEVFNRYARYYDLLYRDKDYTAESRYIQQLISMLAPGAKSILELGCGTGRHASLLAAEGFDVLGVDMSEDMLKEADRRRNELEGASRGRLEFLPGDIREVRFGKRYDVILSLFHVVSYLSTNQDLHAAFQTVRSHLKPGGLFLFDCWYGPAVLTLRPETRVKRLEDQDITVTRIAEPVMHVEENCVDVNYQVIITDKHTRTTESVGERHRMRYLFLPEIRQLLSDAGMEMAFCYEWMTTRESDARTWSACIGGLSSSPG